MIKISTTTLLTGLILFSSGLKAKEINLIDYGVKPWSYENASPAIVKALNEAKGEQEVVIKFPGGRIDLWPEGAEKKELYISNTTESDTLSKVKNIGIFLEEFQNVVIDGNNTLVVLHGKMVSFALINSHNVTIKNISFDYERPTMSELNVAFVSDSLVKLAVHPDTKFDIQNGKVVFYGEGWRSKHHHTILAKPDMDMMHYNSWKPFQAAIATKESASTISFKGDFSNTGLKSGDVLTIRDPYRDNCGAFISLSKNIALENVKMHYMHGLGIVSQFTENISLNKVEVAPRNESGRVVSAWADCFHFSGCKGLIQLDSCRTSGSHDDPMNVHGTHLKITKIENGNQLTVRFMHHQTYGFEAFFAGDSVAFVNPENILIYDVGKIRSARLVSEKEMILDMDGKLPKGIKVGDCLENITWTPEVVVRNCHFQRTNTRGLLITTRRKVLIENNTFYRTGMHAILIANDCNFWYESGPVLDVTIRGNKFIQCAYNQQKNGYVIAIKPEVHNFEKGKYSHSNILVEANVFECVGSPVLFARSVNNLQFKNNTISYLPIKEPVANPVAGFKLEHCKGVEIEANRFEGFLHKKLELKDMTKEAVKVIPENLFQ